MQMAYLFLLIKLKMENNANSELVRKALSIFIIVALSISVFQQFRFISSRNAPLESHPENQEAPPPQILNGTHVEDLFVRATDKYDRTMKDLIAKNGYAIEVKPYEFKGNAWWFHAFLNYGHILIVYILMNKYQTAEAGLKKKIMFGGGAAVLAWFFATPYLKQQRIALEYRGNIVYESQTVNQALIVRKFAEYDQHSAFGGSTPAFVEMDANDFDEPAPQF